MNGYNNELAAQLCSAFELDPSDVTDMTINFRPGGFIRVSVDLMVVDGKRVGTAFEQYEILATKVKP